jgi:hypothetical protein
MEDPTLATQFIVHRTDSFRNEVEAIAKIDPNVHQREYAFADRMAALGVTYEYRLELMGRSGESDWFGPVTARLPWPTQLRWISYQPNPFQHTTQLTLVGLPNEPTSVSVFDVAGRRVRELLQEASPSGITRLRWDGTDDLGNPARAGMYIVHALQGGRSATAKILKIP